MPISRINTNSIANNTIQGADLLDASVTAAKIISVANTQITGNIVSSQITSVANTQLTGTITGSQISSNTLSNTVFQTGSVENYMNAQGLGFGMRNRIINGDMRIDQRNAGATSTSNGVYTADRWGFGAGVASKMTYGQNYNSLTPPAGFANYFGFKTTTAYTVGASEFFLFYQSIEGYNTADLNFGTANAETITVSFWVNSTLTGTFGGVLYNSAQNRAFPFTYTINAASTWEKKTITIPGDTSGTWLTTNGVGLTLTFGLGVGSTNNGTATGAWQAAAYLGATGATSVVATLNATWNITGVQLEKGSKATSFDYRSIGTETDLCRRYYLKVQGGLAAGCAPSNQVVASTVFPVAMRATPTADLTAAARIDAVGIGSVTQSPKTISSFSGTLSATGAGLFLGNFAGVTAGASAVFYDSTNGGGDFTFSAEL
jgi:hypothetical protein